MERKKRQDDDAGGDSGYGYGTVGYAAAKQEKTNENKKKFGNLKFLGFKFLWIFKEADYFPS